MRISKPTLKSIESFLERVPPIVSLPLVFGGAGAAVGALAGIMAYHPDINKIIGEQARYAARLNKLYQDLAQKYPEAYKGSYLPAIKLSNQLSIPFLNLLHKHPLLGGTSIGAAYGTLMGLGFGLPATLAMTSKGLTGLKVLSTLGGGLLTLYGIRSLLKAKQLKKMQDEYYNRNIAEFYKYYQDVMKTPMGPVGKAAKLLITANTPQMYLGTITNKYLLASPLFPLAAGALLTTLGAHTLLKDVKPLLRRIKRI